LYKIRKIMEIHLNNEQIKEFLTIIEQKIDGHYLSAKKAIERCDEITAAMQEGEAIGYSMARDILFMLDQIIERKDEKGIYYTDNMPRHTLEWFFEETDEQN